MQATHDLPSHVHRVLEEFIAVARQICGDALRSVVLYGSGAEGKLRATSDVNLVLVLMNSQSRWPTLSVSPYASAKPPLDWQSCSSSSPRSPQRSMPTR